MKLLFALRGRKYLWFILLMFCLGIFTATVSAGPSSMDQAKRAKIDITIRIATEQIKRGLYQQAQIQLENLKASDEFTAYISERQNQIIIQLQTRINRALEERAQITRILQQSDVLAEQGEYQDALKLLRQIKDSAFASDQEQQMIQASYQKVAGQNQQQQKKWQALYDSSVAAYRDARFDLARAGFVQVVESGYAVDGDKTPEQYIRMIDMDAAVEPKVLTPVAQESTAVSPEPAMVDIDIEPIELLEIEVDKQTADAASAQAQQDERSYLQTIKAKRATKIAYTQAVAADAIEKAEQALTNQKFEQAHQSLRKAFSTIDANKMLLGDVLYGDYMARLTDLEQKVGEAQLAADTKAEEDRRIEAGILTGEIRQKMEAQRKQAVADYMERAFAFQQEQRYEEALGQLEQLLSVDPLNQRALILKQTLKHTVNFIEQRNTLSEIDEEELEMLMEVQRRNIPYSDDMTFPRDWKEIAEKRDALLEKGDSPADMVINELLDKTVDLSILTEDTTLEEAIGILQDAVSPTLPILVYWRDLSENAFIEKDTVINLSGEGL